MEKWGLVYLDCGVNGNIRLGGIIKNRSYPLEKPLFHHSTIPLFHDCNQNY